MDPSGAVSRNIYDSRNRLIRRIDNSLGTTALDPGTNSFGRDLVGLLRETDMQYQYGRVTEMRTPSWGGFGTGGSQAPYKVQINRVEFGADVMDDTFAVVSLNNALVGTVFVQGESGEEQRFRLRYNFEGQIAERTDARNVTMRYSYDALQRLAKVQVGYYLATGAFIEGANEELALKNATLPANLITRVTYTYNSRGQLARVQTNHETGNDDVPVIVDFAYDARGNLISELQAHADYPVPGSEQVVTYLWEYVPTDISINETGHTRLAKIVYPKQLSQELREVNLVYDDGTSLNLADRLSRPSGYTTSVGGPVTSLASFGYTGSGRRTRLGLGGDAIVQDFDLDPLNPGIEGLDNFGQTLGLKYANSADDSKLFVADYRYDISGNRTAVQLQQRS